jgi:hypothetical protein
MVALASVKSIVPAVKGDIHFDITATDSTVTINLTSPPNTQAIVGVPKSIALIKNVTASGGLIWNGQFQSGVAGITWNSEDGNFLKFNVAPGTWQFKGTANNTQILVKANALINLTRALQVFHQANGATVLRYAVPVSCQSRVVIDLYDLHGRRVRTLVDRRANAGYYEVSIDVNTLPAGRFFCRIKAGTFETTVPLLIVW